MPGGTQGIADLNAALMDKFRPSMEAHYPTQQPEFRV